MGESRPFFSPHDQDNRARTPENAYFARDLHAMNLKTCHNQVKDNSLFRQEVRIMARPKSTSSPEVANAPDASTPGEKGDQEAHQNGVPLAMTFEDLLGDDETTDESASDIIRAVRAWRDVTSSRSLD